jgi:hypothetical protein
MVTILYMLLLLLAILNYGFTQHFGHNPIEGSHVHH